MSPDIARPSRGPEPANMWVRLGILLATVLLFTIPLFQQGVGLKREILDSVEPYTEYFHMHRLAKEGCVRGYLGAWMDCEYRFPDGTWILKRCY